MAIKTYNLKPSIFRFKNIRQEYRHKILLFISYYASEMYIKLAQHTCKHTEISIWCFLLIVMIKIFVFE